MLKLITGRLLLAVPLLLAVTAMTFIMFQSMGLDPVIRILGEGVTPESRAALEAEMGLDKPVIVQYFLWLGSALTGDFGTSYFSQRDVAEQLFARLPITLSIAFGGIVIAVVAGIPLGIVSARRPGSLVDRAVSAMSTVVYAVPAFWLALLLVLAFSVTLGWFPVFGYTPFERDPLGWAWSLTLPWLAVGLSSMAVIARHGRSSMIEVLESGFVRSLQLRGVPMGRIVYGYALKNSMLPVIASIVLQAQLAIGAGFIIETVFAIPGLGSLLLDAVVIGDLPILQGAVLTVGIVVVILNLCGDIIYGVIDPKVRPS